MSDAPKRRQTRRSRPRAITIPAKRLARAEKLEQRRRRLLVFAGHSETYERPVHRGDCRGMQRPCPFVSCQHHLYLDVNPETGSIKLNFPELEVWELKETCSLDVADTGGITLEEVGAILNLTRERVRQVEVRGLLKLKRGGASLDRPEDR